MKTLGKKVNEFNLNQNNYYEVLNFTSEEAQQKSYSSILAQVDTSKQPYINKNIDKKRRKAVSSSKTKEIKINVVCINTPSEQSLSNFAVKYQEILNRRGMRDE